MNKIYGLNFSYTELICLRDIDKDLAVRLKSELLFYHLQIDILKLISNIEEADNEH